MTTSEQTDRIAEAFAKAQVEMDNAPMNAKNPHFGNRYADLAAIRNSTVPYLAKHGIATAQTFGKEDGVTVVYTRLTHSSGQWLQGYCPLPAVTDMQKLGSAVTYARRYSLSAMCGIAADEDDDGHEASQERQSFPEDLAKPMLLPPKYDEHLTDLIAKADEGAEAFDKAWKEMPVAFKNASLAAGKFTELKKRAAGKK